MGHVVYEKHLHNQHNATVILLLLLNLSETVNNRHFYIYPINNTQHVIDIYIYVFIWVQLV